MSAALEFDEAEHRYTLDGRVLPSVTQVLDPIIMLDHVPEDILAAAADLGTKIHRAVHLLNQGTLDREALDPVLEPYLAGWEQFLRDSGAVVVASEVRVRHGALGFAGTFDALLRVKGEPWLVDVKSSTLVPRTVWPQISAYLEAMLAERVAMMGNGRGTPGGMLATSFGLSRRTERRCVVLAPDGTYKCRMAPKGHSHAYDWNMFVSCLNVHRWRGGE